MENIILASIAAGGLAVLLAGPAAAQTTNGNTDTSAHATNATFTARNVDPVHPFGSIETYNVGIEPTQVSAWARTLNADQKKDMVGRCSVILQNQQDYYLETTEFCQNFALAIAENAGVAGNRE